MNKTIATFAAALLAVSLRAAPDFHSDVAPVLREYCAGCHNDDDLDGELSVETFAKLMKGGESGVAIVPGKASDSLLLKVLTGRAKPKMPPKREPQPPAEAISTLRQWVDAGAPGPSTDVSILDHLLVPPIAAARGVRPAITAAEYSPDGRTIAIARYGQVELREAGTGKALRRFGGLPGKVNAVHFSANGRRLVAASGISGHSGLAVLWDVRNGRRLREFSEGHRDVLYDAVLTPDGKTLVTAGYDRFIRTWNAESGKQIRSIEAHNGAVFDLALIPDGTILASASADETVKLWRMADGRRLDTLNQPEAEQFAVVFSRDGRFVLAGGADKQIRVWRVISRDEPRINPLVLARYAHEDQVTHLEVSRDGRLLVSAAADRSVKTWRLPSLEPGQLLARQPDQVGALALGPDGRSLWIGRMDGESSRARLEEPSNTPKSLARTETVAPVTVSDAERVEFNEQEPNNLPAQANAVKLPARITGRIMGEGGDEDLFRFVARRGEQWVLEVNAARSKSPLDSHLEVLDAEGRPIERVRLQAVRDTWLTFRGKDSMTAQDFRLFKWREMSLNQLLYVNGEVVKLWHYPRGPDSGYIVYPGTGNRWGYFDTTPMAHPLGQTAYIVEPLASGAEPLPNGLPVFTLNYENDDESRRTMGADSKLTFTAPNDGSFIARVRDIRGFAGADFKYTLAIRPRKPDFKARISGPAGGVPRGSGREFVVSVERLDGFEGPVRVDIDAMPPGFKVTTPIVIEAGQQRAYGAVYAAAAAPEPKVDRVKARATAKIGGREVTHPVNDLAGLKPAPMPKLLATVLPASGELPAGVSFEKPLELTIHRGQTSSARLRIERRGFKGRVGAGKHDAGRNLPHGVYVDNIGLNGLLIVEGQSEREFFITADKWVPETSRLFHIKLDPEKGLASPPVLLHVRRPATVAAR